MADHLFSNMQAAVDIVNNSLHPTNKIAATLSGTEENGNPFAVSYTNYWPDIITEKIGQETRIGNSSGSIHAETACILHAPRTNNASLFITDPPCPNCVKNMAEAGIKALYIDHKGFHKDFATRRGYHFENMSMRICEKAGISVFEIWRKEKKIVHILEISSNYSPDLENPPHVRQITTEESLNACISQIIDQLSNDTENDCFAICAAKKEDGTIWTLDAKRHPVLGYTTETLIASTNKYSFLLEPINRLLVTAAKHGLKIIPETLYAHHVPTSREWVNLIGGNILEIKIGRSNECRDQYGIDAMKHLIKTKIIQVNGIKD